MGKVLATRNERVKKRGYMQSPRPNKMNEVGSNWGIKTKLKLDGQLIGTRLA